MNLGVTLQQSDGSNSNRGQRAGTVTGNPEVTEAGVPSFLFCVVIPFCHLFVWYVCVYICMQVYVCLYACEGEVGPEVNLGYLHK